MRLRTDPTLGPQGVIALYGYRFEIEIRFRQAVRVLDADAYPFWMLDMPARKRGSGNQDIRKRSTDYKKAVHRKMGAYHRFVQLACIAQGLLKFLAIEERRTVGQHYFPEPAGRRRVSPSSRLRASSQRIARFPDADIRITQFAREKTRGLADG